MRSSHFFSTACAGFAAILLVVTVPDARAAAYAPVIRGDCFKAVEATAAGGPSDPRKAIISRSTLTIGETSATMPMEVALNMRNFAEMKARVERGEHISAQELVAKYEPLASDYQAVVDWLTSQGMTVTGRDSHHMAIFVRAPVSRIAQALQVKFARVAYRGAEYTSAINAPTVPASISPLLVGINGLQPHLHPHRHIVRPAASSGTTAYTPAQIAQAYQANGLYSSNITGAGQTIAIVIDTFPNQSDLVAFWDSYGIPQSMNNITFIQAVAGTLDAVSGEETLDTEWASAMAPAAKVRVYAATDLANADLDSAYARVYDDATANNNSLGIHQMSMSYGQGEIETTDAQMQTDDQYFVELANAGVTCFASSGDAGATPAPDGSEAGYLEAESPASDPYVIGVGGTTLKLNSSNNESSEVVWNDGVNGGASGGGTSDYWSRPSWQHGTGVPSGSYRLVPDISCAADPDYGADYYYTDPTYGVESIVGGTSWSCPTCAGFCALINQARANLGLAAIGQSGSQLGALIYPLIGSSSFRDITSGNNATSYSGSTGGKPNWTAGVGYDEATGIGVPLVLSLAESIAQTQTLVGVGQSSTLVTVNEGANAAITVTAGGSPLGYQWQRLAIGSNTWSNLTDNSVYTGTGTASLTIVNTTTAMSGDQFQCVVTYAGNTVTSVQPTALIVEAPHVLSTLAGDAGTSGLVNAMGAAAKFNYPTGIAVDGSGNVYIADLDNNNIREVTPAGLVSTPYGSPTGVAGSTNGSGNSGTAPFALFDAPRDIAIDGSGNLYVADEVNSLIRKINTATGQVTTIGAGTTFSAPRGVAVDSAGNVYVADSGNNVIRKIAASNGAVTILAGSSSFAAGYADGAGTQALFSQPIGMAVDSAMNVYVADYGNECVRVITPAGAVSTLAGRGGVAGCLDGAGKTQALFNVPRGITVDSSGNVYVTDSAAPAVVQDQPTYSGNELLREISPAGVVTTLAGQAGVAGTANGLGSAAQLYNPCGVTMGANNILYIADAGNNTVRMAVPNAVSLSATIPYGSATLSSPGHFTVSRTGSTGASLTLTYSLANSTAVAGTDYTALPGTVTIPAGASSATIAVTPLSNPQATANRTVELTLTSTIVGTVISSTPATVTLIEAPAVTFPTWQANNPDPAAPLGDGVPDLAKYVFDIDPSVSMTSSERAALPTSGMMTSGSTTYFTLTYREYAGLSGTTTVTAQMSSNLQTWSTAPTPTVIGVDSTTQDPIMQVAVPYTGTTEFLRLNIAP